MLGKDYKLLSFSDKDAVFSLPAAAEEFGTGTFVGGLLSGGQAAAHGIMNPAKYAINVDGDVAVNPTSAQTTVEPVQPLTKRDIINSTQMWMQQINDATGIQPDDFCTGGLDGGKLLGKQAQIVQLLRSKNSLVIHNRAILLVRIAFIITTFIPFNKWINC